MTFKHIQTYSNINQAAFQTHQTIIAFSNRFEQLQTAGQFQNSSKNLKRFRTTDDFKQLKQ